MNAPPVISLAVAGALLLAVSGAAGDEPPSEVIDVRGGRIRLVLTSPELTPALPRLKSWAGRSAATVAAYYGRFPVDDTFVFVTSNPGSGVGHGVAFREGIINVAVGANVTEGELRDDWVLTHEMIHLALPDLDRRHVWLSEGISTYVESIARVHVGDRTAVDVWFAFTRAMPQGLPQPGDQGLDRTHTWGRTYWGGALFCLLADVGIRERTNGRKGLQDALAGLAVASRGDASRWPIDRVMQVGDEATGTTVLSDLYADMNDSPVSPDLDVLWSSLGVRRDGGTVRLDDNAPGARTRRLIMSPSTSRQD